MHALVADLHQPSPTVFWADLLASAIVGWTAFAVAVLARAWSPWMWAGVVVSGFALYRGLCFTHEITHLRRRSLPGFETAWNLLFGAPLLLPSFTYIGVHQSHHSLATYGTDGDPEYLPFARSRKLIYVFAVQSAFLMPVALVVRFMMLAPIGLAVPAFHRGLDARASSFSMNPRYVRIVTPAVAAKIRRWELVMIAIWVAVGVGVWFGAVPARVLPVWLGVIGFVSFFNTLRVLGAHEYESDGAPRDRMGQLRDSIDTPGGPWTELWAPVGLRYHALHHFFPGIPYHNLGLAYRRLLRGLAKDEYLDSTSPSLYASLSALHRKARDNDRRIVRP
jgi:fatty acid desaturase